MSNTDHYRDEDDGELIRFDLSVYLTIFITTLILTVFIFDASRDVTTDIDGAVQTISDACQLKLSEGTKP